MNCLNCKSEFEPLSKNKAKQKYCSDTCYKKEKYKRFAAKNLLKILTCLHCKAKFSSTRKKTKFCSSTCSSRFNSFKLKKFLSIPDCVDNASRKIDKTLGYVRVYAPMHPEANTWGYVYEHRVIAEQMIGRRLLKDEVVHHKNGIRWDNNLI